MGRQGKHKEGKVSVGLYVDEDFRALLAFVVDQSGETATDIIMAGVRAKATELGIMKNGKVLNKYLPAIQLIKETYATKRNAKNAR